MSTSERDSSGRIMVVGVSTDSTFVVLPVLHGPGYRTLAEMRQLR